MSAPPGPSISPSATVLSLSTAPGHLVRRAQQVHTSLWTERMRGDLTGPQYALLAALALEPGIDQTRLGELASLDKNTTTDMVRRMQAQGWVERAEDQRDRRRRRLRLTASAIVALRYATPAAAAVQVELLEPVPASQQRRLMHLLGRVAYSRCRPPTLTGTRDSAPGSPGGAATPARSAAATRAAPPAAPAAAAGAAAPVEAVPAVAGGADVLELSTAPGHLLRRVQQLHGAIWSETVGREPTAPQYALLAAVAGRPCVDQATAGALASLDRSSTADITSRLTRAGWLVCQPDEADRRRRVLRLTDEAVDRLSRLTPLAGEVQRELLAALRAPEAAQLVSYLSLIAYGRAQPGRPT